MYRYNKYLAAGLVLSLLSFSTNALADEDNNSSTDAVSEYNNDNNDFSANSVVEHDNDFCISGKSEDYWKKVNFSIDKYAVTPGQPFSGIDPKNQPSDKTCVRVRSGRKTSMTATNMMSYKYDPVLALVKNKSAYRRSTQIYFANFSFRGTLTLTNKKDEVFSCPNVVIGQSDYIVWNRNVWFLYNNLGSYNVGDFYTPETVTNLPCIKQGNQVYIKFRSAVAYPIFYTPAVPANIFKAIPL